MKTILLLSITALFTIAGEAHAFKFTPMTSQFPAKKNASRKFTVENNSNGKIAVQIRVVRRSMNQDGTEKLTDAKGDFMIYPKQIILSPMKKQTVRATWLGGISPKKELPYRFIAEQLPVEGFEKKLQNGAMIKILLRYMTSIYVTPEGVKPNFAIVKADISQKKKLLTLKIRNKGTAHGIMSNPAIRITSSENKGELNLEKKDLEKLEGQNILPGENRIFKIKLKSSKIPKAPLKIDFKTGYTNQ